MNRITTPHPTDAELLAYLDGEMQWDDHITQCAACQTRVETLRAEEKLLNASLFRTLCPDPLTLGEYALNMLSGAKADEIAQHIAVCPHCSNELAQQQTFLAVLAPTPTINILQTAGHHVQVLIAHLISSANDALPTLGVAQPALAGIRGGIAEPLTFEAGDYQIVIEFQPDTEHAGAYILLGLLLGDAPLNDFEVQLWQGGGFIAKASVDENGNFSFTGLQSGSYDLKLLHATMEIRVNTLTL